jgi:hypothetical protein
MITKTAGFFLQHYSSLHVSRADFLIREEITVAEFFAERAGCDIRSTQAMPGFRNARTAAGRIYAYSVRPVPGTYSRGGNYLVE